MTVKNNEVGLQKQKAYIFDIDEFEDACADHGDWDVNKAKNYLQVDEKLKYVRRFFIVSAVEWDKSMICTQHIITVDKRAKLEEDDFRDDGTWSVSLRQLDDTDKQVTYLMGRIDSL